MSDTQAATNLGEDSGSTGPANEGKRSWTERLVTPALGKHPERREHFESTSGVKIDRLYTPGDAAALDYDRDLGYPGEFPFTRGIQPTMYRGRFWTMRQYAGFGTAEETNTRFKLLLQAGQTGLSTAFDLPTQMGYDSDHGMALGEVGRVGVAIDSLDDMRTLLDGIPLDQVSTSMTINATASILLAFYIAVADERGIDRKKLSGTIQNDILKEYIARGTYVFPVEPSLRLITDIFAFCNAEVPKWNTISISGYHIREAGATAAQEVAFTFANAMEYVRRAIQAGLPIDRFATRLSFFFASHNDLFEEAAKFRAARRLYARLMRERFDAGDDGAKLRFHTQTGGVTLQAQQPLNNVVRVTVQALAAALGGTQSLHTNGYDEALSLPTAQAATLALRTQQILAYESGVGDTVDPLAGSYYVESLTTAIEEKARAYLDRIEEMGGASEAIAFMQEEIHRAAYEHQIAVERGDKTIVGVNKFQSAQEEPFDLGQPDFSALEQTQRAQLARIKAERDDSEVRARLEAIREAARGTENLMPRIIDAVKAMVTLGEISDALRAEWGVYRPA
ncbi:acyl-CoA mutase large subunit family protein [Longimicrobium sp.]|uniref:acyl-CoA mutase large subunit family protein n=1 Tax=Longimicrobium sp. TaxID=2029185 RepID=UPI002E3703CC|nr:methylmalonyl-CoA mutase family protein [Longimicrobium sp.]HEX6042110.1 methylmalonyl-CoA mutase family protein [Longimicrobium sp.]